jgi:hypothetical protein
MLLMSCVQSEKTSPTIEDLEPYFVFAEDSGELVGIATQLDYYISNDSIFVDDLYIGKYQKEE